MSQSPTTGNLSEEGNGSRDREERRRLTALAIARLRERLLDLSNRNRLLSFRHSERSRTHIRVIDELPDVLHGKIAGGETLFFKALPEPENEPADEKTDEFLMALESARLFDSEYLQAIERSPDDDPSSSEYIRIERALKDRVRVTLGFAPQPSLVTMSIAEYARAVGLEPSYTLPEPLADGEEPERYLDREIQTLLLPDRMERKLAGLRDQTRRGLEEMGLNTLFAAYGFLEWFESNDSDRALLAPLLLQPLEIDRKKVRSHYRYQVRGTGEDTEINLSLSEKLKAGFGIALPSFGENDTPERYFAEVADAVGRHPRWRVRRFVTVGIYAFGRLVMWHDLDPAKWPDGSSLADNDVLLDMLAGFERPDTMKAEEYDVDDPEIAALIPLLITDADSSQLSALVDVMKGCNVAIKGPPGTGKSQTITNIIAAALATGKRVLFVAEKMAALDVVKKRLDWAGLGHFCLEAHSSKAGRKELAKSLEQRLEIQDSLPEPVGLDSALEELDRLKARLDHYADTLNQPFGRLDMTVQELMWAEQRARSRIDLLPDGIDQLFDRGAHELTSHDLGRTKSKLEALERAAAELIEQFGSTSEHPWSGVTRADLTIFDQEDVVACFQRWHDSTGALLAELEGLGSRLSAVPPQSLTDTIALRADVLERLPEAPTDRLNGTLLVRLRDEASYAEAREFIELTTARAALRGELALMCSDPEAVAASDPAWGAVEELAASFDLSQLDLGELDGVLESSRCDVEQWRAIMSEAVRVLDAFGVGGEPRRTRLAPALAALGRLVATERETLLLRAPELMDELNLEPLERAARECHRLKAESEEMNAVFFLDDLVGSGELRRDMEALRDPGFLGPISNRYRKARKRWRHLSREKSRPDKLAMAGDLERIADHLDAVAAFERSWRVRAICGSRFFGLRTNFHKLVAVAQFARGVRQDTAVMGQVESAVRQLLLEGEADRLTALAANAGTAAHQALREAVIAPSDSGEDRLSMIESRLVAKVESVVQLIGHTRELGLTLEFRFCNSGSFRGGLEELERLDRALAAMARGRELLLASTDSEGEFDQGTIRAVSYAGELHEVLGGGDGPRDRVGDFLFAVEAAARRAELTDFSARLADHIEAFTRAAGAATEQAGLAASFHESGALGSEGLAGMYKRIGHALDHREMLPAWISYLHSIEEAEVEGVRDLLALYGQAGRPLANLVLAYERVVYRSLVRLAFKADPALGRLSGLSQDEARARFRGLDREIIALQRELLAARLSRNRIPPGNGQGRRKTWTDLALIRNQIGLQQGHRPTRELMVRAGGAIQAMKPCFMMSPASVALFLESGRFEFDLVVIDEASQMRPEEAIGAIGRGRQLVVVGDPMQLPPTSFFRKLGFDDGDDDEDDLGVNTEAILDLALDVFQPHRDLRWHYRSRHESLIAFSNRQFYDDRLIVFPSPRPRHEDYGVKFRPVDGTYRGKGGNVDEVREVAHAAIAFMKRHPGRSLGVATLNIAQRDLLAAEFDRLALREPLAQEYLARWDGTLEPFFIKNLENVQGDERDVIFISTVFGPGEDGKVMQRFGPINNRQAGHRRLNVLFTRAKEKVEVFSSMRANDILIGEDPSYGVRAFKAYLEYAATGRLATGKPSARPPDSDFEIFVADALRRRGYEVTPQIGVAGFFIDLAVRHPAVPDGYLLGIECDGASYHSAKSVRDRDALRQEVLENLGWDIYRIWSTDWFADPKREIDKLVGWIESLANRYSEIVSGDEDPSPPSPDAPAGPAPERPDEEDPMVVKIGDTVTLGYADDPGRDLEFLIHAERHDPSGGLVHCRHPFGVAVLGRQVGDEFEVEAGGRLRSATIKGIDRAI